MQVMLDLVPNHTRDQHPWFQGSRASREDGYREMYVWRDPKPDGSAPNNWRSFFGGSAWEFDEPGGQFYLHSFLSGMFDLDWWTPRVRDTFDEILRFWFSRGIAGFPSMSPTGSLKIASYETTRLPIPVTSKNGSA